MRARNLADGGYAHQREVSSPCARKETPNQHYSGPGSQHPETSNSTRQHPPKTSTFSQQLSVRVRKVKTEKSSKAVSSSVQCACSHHQFTIQCYWKRRGSRSCRSSPRACILWIAYVRVKWFPTDCALAPPLSLLARSVPHTRTSFWIVEGGALWDVLLWTPQQNLIRIYPNITKCQCCHIRLL